MVEDRLPLGRIGIEQATLPAGSHSHADSVADTCSERARGALDEPGVTVFRMTRAFGSPGPQRLQVIKLHVSASEIQLAVLGEGGMAERQDETVTSEPLVILRVHIHDLLVQQIGHRRE